MLLAAKMDNILEISLLVALSPFLVFLTGLLLLVLFMIVSVYVDKANGRNPFN